MCHPLKISWAPCIRLRVPGRVVGHLRGFWDGYQGWCCCQVAGNERRCWRWRHRIASRLRVRNKRRRLKDIKAGKAGTTREAQGTGAPWQPTGATNSGAPHAACFGGQQTRHQMRTACGEPLPAIISPVEISPAGSSQLPAPNMHASFPSCKPGRPGRLVGY